MYINNTPVHLWPTERKLAPKDAAKEQEKESKPERTWEEVTREEEAMEAQAAQNGKEEGPPEQNGEEAEMEEKPKQEKKMGVHRGRVQKISPNAAEKQELEEKKLAIMMIPRKKKKVYHILRRREKRKETGARILTQKRIAIDHERNKAKKAKKAEV